MIENYCRRVITVVYTGDNALEVVNAMPIGSFSIDDAGDLIFFMGYVKVPVGHVCYFENTDPRVDSPEVFYKQFIKL